MWMGRRLSGAAGGTPHLARPLFYACVRLELDNRWAHDPASERVAAERRKQLGDAVFSEIRSILLQDDRLFQSPSDLETYVEFVASYAEMRYFAPREMTCHFPGVQDWQRVDDIVRQDLDHRKVFDRLRLHGWQDILAVRFDAARTVSEVPASGEPLTLAEFRRLQMKAERAAAAGNPVKAALLHLTASLRGPDTYRAEAHTAAHDALAKLTERLRDALDLGATETDAWGRALQALLVAPDTWPASVEARLLYDLQRTCVERERRIHRPSLWQWIVSRGRRPCDRPLPLLGEVLTLRHLRKASRRVAGTRMDIASRQQLATLLEHAVSRAESRTRRRLRRIIDRVLAESGLRPENGPERVAREKVVEELTDRILERSYLSMADLRDAISNNDLKLPDITDLRELVRGDRLLQTDRAFSDMLDGVYRRGTVYQRWPQVLSSLAFGTRTGRFLTQFVAVPYGGAYLALECLRHLGHYPSQSHAGTLRLSAIPVAPPAGTGSTNWLFLVTVFCLGTWISLLIHRPDFRRWNLRLLTDCTRYARRWFVDLPARVLRSSFVQYILASEVYRVLQNYLLRPLLFTTVVSLCARLCGYQWSARVVLELSLASALFLNSALGRFVTEWTANYLLRLWRELRIRVIGSLAQWIMDLFRRLAASVEQLVNLIDEWLRLRRGNSVFVRTCKLVGGVVWFVVAYILIFVFTLLVEPQVNPIKHFPVVTVSHKLILPAGPSIARQLSTVLGAPLANTLVWTTIWLVPGVCGYLVWELKENWRLYRANRPHSIRSETIGSHGETMLQLLRPGFHSGTLPKAYCALRRAVQSGEPPESKRYLRKSAVIQRVKVDVQRFVERELLYALKDQGFLPGEVIQVRYVHASTNRIDVELTCTGWPDQATVVTWEYWSGQLLGKVAHAGWISRLNNTDRRLLAVALSGLFQRAGVEGTEGPLPLTVSPPYAWSDWVEQWQHGDTASLATNTTLSEPRKGPPDWPVK